MNYSVVIWQVCRFWQIFASDIMTRVAVQPGGVNSLLDVIYRQKIDFILWQVLSLKALALSDTYFKVKTSQRKWQTKFNLQATEFALRGSFTNQLNLKITQIRNARRTFLSMFTCKKICLFLTQNRMQRIII